MTPKLYYYEHCPYCIRVLSLAGMANIAISPGVLLNDDEITPVKMVGRKMLPILEIDTGIYMAESLDIMAYLGETYGVMLVHNTEWEQQVGDFLAANREIIYGLSMPRWIKQPFAEFATKTAVDYFVKKKTMTIGDFDTALVNTPILTAALNDNLRAAEDLFRQLQDNPRSYAAIILFSGLYGVRYVGGFQWPNAAKQFMQQMATASEMSL